MTNHKTNRQALLAGLRCHPFYDRGFRNIENREGIDEAVRLSNSFDDAFLAALAAGHDLSQKQNEAFCKVAADWNRQAEALIDGRDLPTLAERE
jgi:hypothetical protein